MRFQVRLISGIGIGVVMESPRYLSGMKTLREAKERAEAMYPQAVGTWKRDPDNTDSWVKRGSHSSYDRGATELWLFRGRRRKR